MAGNVGREISQVFAEEFESWLQGSDNDTIYLLENEVNDAGGVTLLLLLGGEYEFKLHCPSEYPSSEGTFHVETNEPSIKLWAIALNEFLTDSNQLMCLKDVLAKAHSLHRLEHKSKRRKTTESEDSEMDIDEEYLEAIEPDENSMLSDDESVFTTEWELKVARKKKRWTQKEEEIRESLKRAKLGPAATVSSQLASGAGNWITSNAGAGDAQTSKNIFTSSAASGVLTNDLVKILMHEEEVAFTAEPVADNIYQWCVKFYNFDPSSDLAADLDVVNQLFGYKHIELQLDFTMDLYPFYPPIVKVIRPRLQGSMMQRVTNMEILKLSFWNPTKDMMSLLQDIKEFLQNWARLEGTSERNDRKKYPKGSYVEIEHHLLKLALVSEVNPRANFKYAMEFEKPPDLRVQGQPKTNGKKKKEEFWAAGTGFGHNKRPEWDIKAYLAAQKEKDKQIESVLHSILQELKLLYANHAPQLKPKQKAGSCVCSRHTVTKETAVSSSCDHQCIKSSRKESESIDPVEDMFNILEGSALVPFMEQYLNADSFLEICRHTVVYKAIVDILREVALQNQLVPLLAPLPSQHKSVYQLLKVLEEKANILLQHICKAGNGHVPKPAKPDSHHSHHNSKKSKVKYKNLLSSSSTPTSAANNTAAPTASPPTTDPHHFHMVSTGGGGVGSDAMVTVDDGMVTTTMTSAASTNPFGGKVPASSTSTGTVPPSSEEKLAREFQVLLRDVKEGFNRSGVEHSPAQVLQLNGGDQDDSIEFLKNVDKDTVLEERYKKALEDLQFDTCDMQLEGSGSHKYAKDYQKQGSITPTQICRIAQEVTSLATSLPLNLSSSIFVRTDDEKLTVMRALITGPESTPYSGGCFLFDVFFPATYPLVPPRVNLQTTGGGTVRFNPNLYNCGKVCLSLLGTWEGQQGEQWNETTSTVLQVLVSIQSLILVPEPYFNEPGYETEIGTDAGRRHSAEYNSDVRINNIKHAMISPLQHPPAGFEDVIKAHFFVKRDRILQEVEHWMRKDPSSKLERSYQNLKTELLRIELPENIANILQSMQVQNITSSSQSSRQRGGSRGLWGGGGATSTEVSSKSNTTSGSSSEATLRTASSSQSSIGSNAQPGTTNTTTTTTTIGAVDSTSLVEVHQVDTGHYDIVSGEVVMDSQEAGPQEGSMLEAWHEGSGGSGVGIGVGIGGVGGGCAVTHHPGLIEVIPIQTTDSSSESGEDGDGF